MEEEVSNNHLLSNLEVHPARKILQTAQHLIRAKECLVVLDALVNSQWRNLPFLIARLVHPDGLYLCSLSKNWNVS